MIKSLKRTLGLILSNKVNKSETSNVSGKVVVVTGGSRGLGLDLCNFLVMAGAKVYYLSRKNSGSNKAVHVSTDITNLEDILKSVQKIESLEKCVDVLINNAAVTESGGFENLDILSLETALSTNIKAPVVISSKFLPLLKESRAPLIINVGSKISRNPNISDNKVIYAVTKYSMEGLSNALRSSLRQYGIRVVCILPGTINTQFSLKSGDFISSGDVSRAISFVIENSNIDFENFVVKGKFQENVG